MITGIQGEFKKGRKRGFITNHRYAPKKTVGKKMASAVLSLVESHIKSKYEKARLKAIKKLKEVYDEGHSKLKGVRANFYAFQMRDRMRK